MLTKRRWLHKSTAKTKLTRKVINRENGSDGCVARRLGGISSTALIEKRVPTNEKPRSAGSGAGVCRAGCRRSVRREVLVIAQAIDVRERRRARR